jgi:hypothetical protein
MGLGEKTDLEILRQNTTREANQLIAYIVDMAKAEALDAMGEDRVAVELIQRHLEI